MASRRTLLVVGIVVVLGLIATAVLVLPRLLGPNLTDASDVADIFTEPHVAWSYDYVGENDREFLDEAPQVTTIGDHRALVWASFDYSAYLEEGGSVPPDFTPAVSAIDTLDGSVLWTSNLADAGADYSSTYFAQDIEGSNAVALFVSTFGGAEASYAVVALDKNSGAVLSQLSTPGSATGAPLDGDLVLAIADETGESSRIARYSPTGLDGDPRWSTDVEGTAYLAIGEGFVIVQGSEHGTVLNGSNGKKAGWGQDIDYDTGYAFIGSQLVRIETAADADSYTVEGWSASGTSSWSKPISVTYFDLTDTGLFSSEGSESGYSALQRIDPSTGEDTWKHPFAKPFDHMLGVQGDALLLHDGNRVIVLDLASGEERFTEKLGDFSIVYEGSSLYYVPLAGKLAAHKYSVAGEVWSFDLSDAQTATAAGGRLAIIDSDKGTLSGLAG